MSLDALLVCMPWDMLRYPSIPLGILVRVLQDRGLRADVRQYNVRLLRHLTRDGSAPPREWIRRVMSVTEQYDVGLGDWIFAVPPYRAPDAEADAQYMELLERSGVDPKVRQLAIEMRAAVPSFIDECVEDVLASDPKVVGFTTAFNQNVASLVLAKRLKEARPDLKIVFGGGNCEGAMGEALLRGFDCIDVVVRGEAEEVAPALFRELVEGRAITPRPGLCYRDGGGVVIVPQGGGSKVPMDDVPRPDYDAYFRELDALPARDEVLPLVRLLYEASRGCWWGAKSHCTFCGINDMAFRSRAPERVRTDLRELTARYKVLSVDTVDHILDWRYLKSLIPDIAKDGYDYRLFFEIKANLKETEVRALKAAGVRTLQPGIESLSTPILRRIKKGVSAPQNIRLLKWCSQYGIRVLWNLIYGFPGEEPAEYERMAGVVKLLTHLPAPELNRLHVDRFSPYHSRPAEHGISVRGPLPHYRFLYPVSEGVLDGIAYHFAYEYDEPRDPEAYVAPLRAAVRAWKTCERRDRRALRYRLGPGFMNILDGRTHFGPRHLSFSEREARVYLAAGPGATPASIGEQLGLPVGEVEDVLQRFVDEALVLREGDLFLSLALSDSEGEPHGAWAPMPRTADAEPAPERRRLALIA